MREPTEHGFDCKGYVLVVEDELFIAMELKAVLTEAGYQVMGPASSVQIASDLICEARPGAAVLDFSLAGENVIPVALQLKAMGVPFVLASATDATELARYAVFEGIKNLGKPTDIKRLVDVVGAL